ncbi:radA [Symbiodinium microadriaticum]|nr:radA [Symbiodinium microadriaticum]
MIELKDVHKSFGPKKVLQGVDLTVKRGTSLVVIGGSGTGKSVMLKCILGILKPETGSIRVDGEDTIEMNAKEREASLRRFGMLFQGAALFDSLPVWENVAFGLIQGRNMARKDAKDLAIDTLARVGLEPDVGDLNPAELSGGMQKRVGLARAIAANPEIIFFDEPTTGLDPIMADVINNLIVDTVKDMGATTLSITHDMASARKIADEIAMIYRGQILWQGSVDEIDDSGNDHVDQFINGTAFSMAKAQSLFVCQSCGSTSSKWAGRCDACGEWNSLVEEAVDNRPKVVGGGIKGGKVLTLNALSESAGQDKARQSTGNQEFDTAIGGGLVLGSAILIGGDPGIGKSTVLLQVMANLAGVGKKALYISGEESTEQVGLRARRLGLADKGGNLQLAAGTDLASILATIDAERPDVVVVDSIQTLHANNLESAPGTVAQVRACASTLIARAKQEGFALFIVGHVTKDGQIAGPRVLEHMVDTVLYFEGERAHQCRILRSVKNRFGATDEIGVFEMSDQGLIEVRNPSALFLGNREEAIAGASVFAGMEGSRPLLTELQALTAPAAYGTPRRAVVGWDQGRLSMLLAVLEARCNLSFSGSEVYLNVAGGLRIVEPAADLAAAGALISALTGNPLARDSILFGEVALSGEIRNVSQADKRLKEAERLGFTTAYLPADQAKKLKGNGKIKLVGIAHLSELAGKL